MIASTQIKKPTNWQDFEKLCKLLWGEIWNCEDSIKRHGRQGQNQHGVDVYAYVEKYGGYCGIQCKGKDDYTKSDLSENEIDDEIRKALTFEPELKLLIFATTAVKNARIERFIRKKDVENRKKGLFKVDIASWEDIVEQLERYKTTYNWYANNCQFKDATDVCVTFDGEEVLTIYPEFIRTTVHYEYKELTPFEKQWKAQLKDFVVSNNGVSMLPWNQRSRIDKRWCEIHIHIENTGNTVIKNPKVKILFRPDDVEIISDRFSYLNAWGIDEAAKAQINASRDAKRELFKTYSNEIEYRPKESVFLQTDERNFTISIIPKDGVMELPLIWEFLCEDYQKKGFLTINVQPVIENITETKVVNNMVELKPDEVTIAPKIIED